jgi:hypothetical protein
MLNEVKHLIVMPWIFGEMFRYVQHDNAVAWMFSETAVTLNFELLTLNSPRQQEPADHIHTIFDAPARGVDLTIG